MSQPLPNESAVPTEPTTQEPADTSLLDSVIARSPAVPRTADGIAVGCLDALASDGSPLVSIPSFGLTGVTARTLTPLDPARIGETVALGFESGDPMRPIILGFMLQQASAPATQQAKPAPDTEVLVDGERVVLTAEHEIELRCGEAALVLRADGRIHLRGTYITSHASATQRIFGGSVNLN